MTHYHSADGEPCHYSRIEEKLVKSARYDMIQQQRKRQKTFYDKDIIEELGGTP